MALLSTRGSASLAPRRHCCTSVLSRAPLHAPTRIVLCCAEGSAPEQRDDAQDDSKPAKAEDGAPRPVRSTHLRTGAGDTPLRDANREFLLGVLTARATRTLIAYLQETNVQLSYWLMSYHAKHPINLAGSWEEISGDAFLRKLLSMPVEEVTWGEEMGAAAGDSICVDPRNIAQRILQIRAAIAKELQQDLYLMEEENVAFMRRTQRASLESCLAMSAQATDTTAASASGEDSTVHPELRSEELLEEGPA